MAAPVLIIEDGTAASASANSYVTVAEVTAFCNNYGLTEWATSASNTLYVQAIIRATAFVDSEYEFKGVKYEYDDPLEWPRVGVYDEQGIDPSLEEFYQEIPAGLKNACCRAAYEELKVPGTLQTSLTSNVKREKIDVIETEYFANRPSKTIYRSIEGFIKRFLANPNMAKVLRV
jgi:hypothetical protein